MSIYLFHKLGPRHEFSIKFVIIRGKNDNHYFMQVHGYIGNNMVRSSCQCGKCGGWWRMASPFSFFPILSFFSLISSGFMLFCKKINLFFSLCFKFGSCCFDLYFSLLWILFYNFFQFISSTLS